jgi:hypothetical protein
VQMNTLLDSLGQGVNAYQGVSSDAMTRRNAALAAITDRLSRKPGATYDDPTAAAAAVAVPVLLRRSLRATCRGFRRSRTRRRD